MNIMESSSKVQPAPLAALVYARVSDKKQEEGSGLQSQEFRGRQRAAERGIPVEMVFLDTVSGGSDLLNRPAVQNLLAFLRSQLGSGKRYIVIFDDHKRFARETEMHLRLRRELRKLGAIIEYLNLKVEDSPEGRFVETMFAAQAQLEREQNARQVRQKTTARLEQGYWTFRAPVGYRYIKAKGGGKELVPDEVVAPLLADALNGFAAGRFATVTELKRFIEAQPLFPKDMPDGTIRYQTIIRLLERVLYAGYLEARTWNISVRKARHKPIISLETYKRNQERLREGVYAPMRKDISDEFPLRGAAACSGCGKPLTAGWCQGKYKKYPYYFCQQKGCAEKAKCIARDKLEPKFAAFLRQLQPRQELLALAKAMFDDLWARQAQLAAESAAALRNQLVEIESEIDRLVTRAVDAQHDRVRAAYEERISKLEMQRLVCQERCDKNSRPKTTGYRESIELSLRFLSSPWKLWDSGSVVLQKLVLRLVFSEPFTYCRQTGELNTKTSLPFRALGGSFGPVGEMVLPVRIELTTSALPRMRSTTELRQHVRRRLRRRRKRPKRRMRGRCQSLCLQERAA